jgi:hypothetical protein
MYSQGIIRPPWVSATGRKNGSLVFDGKVLPVVPKGDAIALPPYLGVYHGKSWRAERMSCNYTEKALKQREIYTILHVSLYSRQIMGSGSGELIPFIAAKHCSK